MTEEIKKQKIDTKNVDEIKNAVDQLVKNAQKALA